LEGRLHHRPSQLSGGQNQRAAIARALVNNPKIILADEPTGNLDTATGQAVLELFHELHRQGRTIAIVTHNLQQAARVSDHTAFLFLGNLVEFGPTDTLFTRPKDKRTEDYITGRFG